MTEYDQLGVYIFSIYKILYVQEVLLFIVYSLNENRQGFLDIQY